MSETAQTVLVIEDEPQMQRFLRTSLGVNGYRVLEALTAREGLQLASSHNPELILLDLGLPDGDGLELTRQLREWSKTPIVVLSARGQEQDKIQALDAGADDYLTKPFGVGELLARMRVALRHAARAGEDGEPVFETGELKVDLAAHQVFLAGAEVRLTRTEFNLLAALVKNAGKVVTHRQLLREVWGPGYVNQSQYLRVFIAQLRKKIETDPNRPQIITTEPAVGYRFTAYE